VGLRAQDGLGRRRRSPGWIRIEVRDDGRVPQVSDSGRGRSGAMSGGPAGLQREAGLGRCVEEKEKRLEGAVGCC
jgi:hypothetical protein